MWRITNQHLLSELLRPDSDRPGAAFSRLYTMLRDDFGRYRGWKHRTYPEDREAQIDEAVHEAFLGISSRRLLYLSERGIKDRYRGSDFVDREDYRPIREAEREKKSSGLRLTRHAYVAPTILNAIAAGSVSRTRLERLLPVYHLLLMSQQWWPLWDIYCCLAKSNKPHAQWFSAAYIGDRSKSGNLSTHLAGWHAKVPWELEDSTGGSSTDLSEETKAHLLDAMKGKMLGEFLIAASCPQGHDAFELWLQTVAEHSEILSSAELLVSSLHSSPLSTLVSAASQSSRYPKCAKALNTLVQSLMTAPATDCSTAGKMPPVDKDAVIALSDGFSQFLSLIKERTTTNDDSLVDELGRIDLQSNYDDALQVVRDAGLYRWLSHLPFSFPNIKAVPPPLEEAMINVLMKADSPR